MITNHRAARACQRCRQQKLRCLGGVPCERCVRLQHNCIISSGPQRGSGRKRRIPLDGEEETPITTTRHDQSLSAHRTVDMVRQTEAASAVQCISAAAQEPATSSAVEDTIPPPLHTKSFEAPRIGYTIRHPCSPSIGIHSRKPQASGTPEIGTSFMDAEGAKGGLGMAPMAPSRASESLYEAPFRALLSESRRASSATSESGADPMRWNYTSSMFHADDDPINTGIVDEATAESLFNFFLEHCHPFLPIINVALTERFAAVRQSASLFSAISAVAARFYRKYNNCRAVKHLPLNASCPKRLANLAEAHLGHTLLRRHLAQSDVQASLLLAAWNLQSEGIAGPDAWVVTGHAARISRRLGVHKVLAHAADTARRTSEGSNEWHLLEISMPSWRTWLCWFTFDGFLSLGFGRPQSTQFETVDESGFLKMRLEQCPLWPRSSATLSLSGDVYIASQVQLTQIARDLINWSEMLADRNQAVYSDPRRAETFTNKSLSVENMSTELNERLDDWSRIWVWPNSPYGVYLGTSARPLRLQLEHLRLCLNAFAFTEGKHAAAPRSQNLKFAVNAAINTVQIHRESSETDMGLGFATDYLTIALAQAAVFLIRASQSFEDVLPTLQIDAAVLEHHVSTAVTILRVEDVSETKLRQYLGEQIQMIRNRSGELWGHKRQTQPEALATGLMQDNDKQIPSGNIGASLNFEEFFREQDMLDLASWLEPTDPITTVLDSGVTIPRGNPDGAGDQDSTPDSPRPDLGIGYGAIAVANDSFAPQCDRALPDFDAFMATDTS